MLSNPYSRRSWRPMLLMIIGLLGIFSFYNQTQLREQTYHVQRAITDSLQSIYQAGRTHNNTLYQQGTEDHVVQEYDFGTNPCRDFPDTQGILTVMKTGATEVFDKLPTQLLTNLQCLPDFLLFSDREQQIGQWHVYDALADVSDAVKANNPEFDLYRTQAECPVAQKSCLNTYRGAAATAAWSLDKYKFLHIIERAWQLRPNQTWYLFTEADTYIVWPSLAHWLRTRSPVVDPLEEPAYVGSGAMLAGIPFAHGGSGYLLSGALVRNLVEGVIGLPDFYDDKARTHCCGDQLLAKAILENEGIKLQHAHPMFNGEKPSTLPFGPTHWCEPVLTMHHMDSEEVSAMWQFEQTRKKNSTILMKDLYKAFVANKMVASRTHWDNLSEDVCYIDPSPLVRKNAEPKTLKREKKDADKNAVEAVAHTSLEACARVCQYEGVEDAYEDALEEAEDEAERDASATPAADNAEGQNESSGLNRQTSSRRMRRQLEQKMAARNPLDRRCFQYRYHNGVCCTGRSFKLGTPRREAKGNMADKPSDVWHSGWHMQGIQDWIAAKGECDGPRWKIPDKL
ncbi:hypothetical protein ACHAQH_000558 [Verticillium albo-atrum]